MTKWFAWYPVTVVGGQTVWLRWVYRWKGGWVSQAAGRDVWEYCLPSEDFE